MLEVKTKNNIKILEIKLERPIEPSELQNIKLPEISGEILVITGRSPIWLYCYLVHHYVHLFKVVATYDPKQNGAIIISSHTPKYRVGQILSI